MSLLLALSASHRARLLKHPYPSNRMAMYMQELFPKLRSAISNSPASESMLAPVIMMAYLEIAFPGTVRMHWHSSLDFARHMIITSSRNRDWDPKSQTMTFLISWFSYMDVIGSLGRPGVVKHGFDDSFLKNTL